MRVKLVDPLPLHPTLAIRAIGLRPDGSPVWPLMGADGEEEGSDDDADEGEEDDEEESDDDADGEDDKGSSKTKKRSGPVSREDYDRVKNHLSKADRKKSELERENAELKKFKEDREREGNTELQNLQKDLRTVTEERDSLNERFTTLARTNAFLTASAQAKIVWHDPEDAQAAAGRSLRELEIDEDGNVEGILDLVKDLAKRKKYLVNNGTDDDDDEGERKSTRRGASGSGVGSQRTTKKGKPNGQLTDEELRRRFPALNR